jgi:hypothetical protein
MKAICASVNLNFFMAKTPSAAHAAKMEFSSFEHVNAEPVAGPPSTFSPSTG